MRGLADKVIVVAGGATGMGAAAATRLAEEGSKVVVGDINIERAEQTVASITAAGGKAIAVKYDQGETASVEALIARADDEFGGINGMFANAADLSANTLGADVDVLDMDLAVWERTLRVNLIGFAVAIRAVIPHLLNAGGGSIVCTSSDGTKTAEPTRPAYAASKAGVNTLIRHVASRWGKDNIRCNAVAPGLTMTETGKEAFAKQTKEFVDQIMARIRSPRFGEPEDIANTVAFLLSDDATWVTGQVWAVNGGGTTRD